MTLSKGLPHGAGCCKQGSSATKVCRTCQCQTLWCVLTRQKSTPQDQLLFDVMIYEMRRHAGHNRSETKARELAPQSSQPKSSQPLWQQPPAPALSQLGAHVLTARCFASSQSKGTYVWFLRCWIMYAHMCRACSD